MKGRWGCDEKTFRKWLYIVLDAIADLGLVRRKNGRHEMDASSSKQQRQCSNKVLSSFEQIQWENRYATNSHCNVYITVDGTDFKIKEPRPFSPAWYSHKFNGPAVRYEVGICIATGWIVWFNGPYKPGDYPDLKLAQECGLHECLDEDERYIADGTYTCNQALIPHDIANHYESVYMQWCRTRHEATNKLFKLFKVVCNKFERSPFKHGLFVHAIAQIVQLGIMTGQMGASFDVHDFQQPPSWPGTWEYRVE